MLPPDGTAAARVCLAQRMPGGEPVRLRAASRHSAAFAYDLRQSAGMLLATAESSMWRGPAYRAFTEQLRAQAPTLTATADRYDEYAAALAGYAGALDVLIPSLVSVRQQLQQHSDAAAGGADPAGGLLALARSFQARYDEWLDALERCSRAVLHAGGAALGPHRQGWQALGHAVGEAVHGVGEAAHAVGHASASAVGTFERAVLHPSLANISACLGELNAGLSVLGVALLFVYPPAGAACLAAATVLAIAQLAVDSARRAHGEQVGAGQLGFELAAAIPLGGGALRSLKVADDVVHLVPGGGLAAHEGVRGAHTLAKHVGKSETFLRNRLATEPTLRAASTFYDRQTAEEAVGSLLRSNQKGITSWLTRGGFQVSLIGRYSTPIGRMVERDTDALTEEAGIKVVLRRSPEMANGFCVYTAMVTK
ncbi:MAG: hypothetical protein JO144_16790 [Actinobacteria bacterium]|nr:hypothetical protein [Actinomycetota bacterium]